ncbi:two-component system response regulator [Deinococcus aetherius]|uniref:Two-component system response regulator n=1 Tax=Deinococcus aetherius TaxID=200252 RepID=A0ABN6RFH5_9DEIO|nr:two-component system response regulator [Deinococcus aetherius]
MQPYVLLIEDDAQAIELGRRAFAGHGRFDVTAVQTGQAGLDFLRRAGAFQGREDTLPALVILDLGLPDMPGLDVLDEIKRDERLSFLPVVILTVSEEANDARAARDLGAAFFISKPVGPEEFEATVNAVGHFWSNLSRTPSAPRPRW